MNFRENTAEIANYSSSRQFALKREPLKLSKILSNSSTPKSTKMKYARGSVNSYM